MQHVVAESFEQSAFFTAVDLKRFVLYQDSIIRESKMEFRKEEVIVQEVYYNKDQRSCAVVTGRRDS